MSLLWTKPEEAALCKGCNYFHCVGFSMCVPYNRITKIYCPCMSCIIKTICDEECEKQEEYQQALEPLRNQKQTNGRGYV